MKNSITDIKDKGHVEITKEVQQLRKDIAHAQLEWKTNPPKNTNAISAKKKKLAQYLTVLRSLEQKKTSQQSQ